MQDHTATIQAWLSSKLGEHGEAIAELKRGDHDHGEGIKATNTKIDLTNAKIDKLNDKMNRALIGGLIGLVSFLVKIGFEMFKALGHGS